jgi:hypothetical protein
VLIDGQTIEFASDLVAKHVQDYVAKLLADAKKAEKAVEEEQEEEKKTRGEMDALKGKLAVVEKQLADAIAKTSPAEIAKQVQEATEVRFKADAFLQGKVKLDGKDAAEMRRIVVHAHMGDAAKAWSDEQVTGAFGAITVNVKGTDRLADNLSVLQFGGGGNGNDLKAMKDAAYEERNKLLRDAWKTPQRA